MPSAMSSFGAVLFDARDGYLERRANVLPLSSPPLDLRDDRVRDLAAGRSGVGAHGRVRLRQHTIKSQHIASRQQDGAFNDVLQLDRTGSFSDRQQCGRVGFVESALKVGTCGTAVDSARVDQTKEQCSDESLSHPSFDLPSTTSGTVTIAPVRTKRFPSRQSRPVRAILIV